MTTANDPYNLARFIQAQDPVYSQVIDELAAGRKTTHWVWFIFPQIQGLGRSSKARYYAIADLDEARAYLQHEQLRQRLEECVTLLGRHTDKTPRQIMGSPDDMKLHSSLTLFDLVAPADNLFAQRLHDFFDGQQDGNTLALINNAP